MKKADSYVSDFRKHKNPDEVIDQFLEDPVIRRFVMNNDLKHEVITANINSFLTFKESKSICQACNGLFECKMDSPGMTPILGYYNGDVLLDYKKCRYNTSDDTFRKIDAMYIPRKVFVAELADFDLVGNERKSIHQYIIKFLSEYSKEQPMKGMYLSGIFGGGKTYILACIANELAKLNYQIIFAYYPDLVRELKSSIGTGELEDKIERLKNVDFLFLDDFGGEAPSGFVRDEILGPILQHRVLDYLPTFFSSNLKMNVLVSSLAYEQTTSEKAKAVRIYERIKELAIEFEISEKPRQLT